MRGWLSERPKGGKSKLSEGQQPMSLEHPQHCDLCIPKTYLGRSNTWVEKSNADMHDTFSPHNPQPCHPRGRIRKCFNSAQGQHTIKTKVWHYSTWYRITSSSTCGNKTTLFLPGKGCRGAPAPFPRGRRVRRTALASSRCARRWPGVRSPRQPSTGWS